MQRNLEVLAHWSSVADPRSSAASCSCIAFVEDERHLDGWTDLFTAGLRGGDAGRACREQGWWTPGPRAACLRRAQPSPTRCRRARSGRDRWTSCCFVLESLAVCRTGREHPDTVTVDEEPLTTADGSAPTARSSRFASTGGATAGCWLPGQSGPLHALRAYGDDAGRHRQRATDLLVGVAPLRPAEFAIVCIGRFWPLRAPLPWSARPRRVWPRRRPT